MMKTCPPLMQSAAHSQFAETQLRPVFENGRKAFAATRQEACADTHNPPPQKTVDAVLAFSESLLGLEPQQDLPPARQAKIGDFVKWTVSLPETSARRLLASEPVGRAVPSLRYHYLRAESIIDRQAVNAYFTHGSSPSAFQDWMDRSRDSVLLDHYRSLVDSEMKLLGMPRIMPGMNAHQSVVYVSSGSVPLTAILLHQKTGLRITCIDPCEKTYDVTRRLLDHLGHHQPQKQQNNHGISLLCMQPTKFDYVTNPLIIIDASVPNREAVLSQICASSNTCTSILIRSAEGGNELLFQPFDAANQQAYEIYLVKKTSGKSGDGRSPYNTSLLFRLPQKKCDPNAKANWDFGPENLEDISLYRQRRLWRSQADQSPI
ncbi:MAG: hypothetical protein WDO70_11265 [Alphaproteobacteria bacterium]